MLLCALQPCVPAHCAWSSDATDAFRALCRAYCRDSAVLPGACLVVSVCIPGYNSQHVKQLFAFMANTYKPYSLTPGP